MIIIVSDRFFRYFTRGFATAIALFPFIIIKSRDLRERTFLINHERIHIRQQLETGVLVFYLWYITEFLIRYFSGDSFEKAYRNISFEREAFANDHDIDYLNGRKFWSFVSYFGRSKSN